MSRPKTHFYTSAEPPVFGNKLMAVCGTEVSNAQPIGYVDADYYKVYGDLARAVTCADCAESDDANDRRYVAVIMEGQEALNEAVTA